MTEFVGRFSTILEIDYRDLDRDPRGTLIRVAEFLGAPNAAALQVDLARMPQKISGKHVRMGEYLARFRQELRDRDCGALSSPAAADLVVGCEPVATPEHPKDAGSIPAAQQLRALVDGRKSQASALLEGVDLDADHGAAFDYYAGMALGAVGQRERAIELLERAAAGGFAAFWCAYHLGLFEMKRGEAARAAYYYAVSLMLQPDRTEIYPLLEQVAPKIEPASLRAVQDGSRSEADAPAAFDLGLAVLEAGSLGGAAFYFAIALARDPGHSEARNLLFELAPDISLAVLPGAEAGRPAQANAKGVSG